MDNTIIGKIGSIDEHGRVDLSKTEANRIIVAIKLLQGYERSIMETERHAQIGYDVVVAHNKATDALIREMV